MLRSILLNGRYSYRLPVSQRRSFHPSPIAKSTSVHSSHLLASGFDYLHFCYGLPCLLVIPLVAAIPHFIRLPLDLDDVNHRFGASRIKPVQSALASLNEQRLANGQKALIRGAACYIGGENLVETRSFLLGKILPFSLNVAFTASALLSLRSNTYYYQFFQRESISDFITWLCGNDIGQKLMTNIDTLSSSLELQSIPSIPLPLVAAFCFYQYFQLFLKSQFWQGWTLGDMAKHSEMKHFGRPQKWHTAVRFGQLVVRPMWLQRIQIIYRWRAWKEWFRILYLAPQKFKRNDFYRLIPFAVAIPVYAVLVHFVNVNSAQLFYMAATSTFARLRTRLARNFEGYRAANLERRNKKWERLEPTSKR